MSDKRVPTGRGIACPFCAEDDFDLVGLEIHLRRYCERVSLGAVDAAPAAPAGWAEPTEQEIAAAKPSQGQRMSCYDPGDELCPGQPHAGHRAPQAAPAPAGRVADQSAGNHTATNEAGGRLTLRPAADPDVAALCAGWRALADKCSDDYKRHDYRRNHLAAVELREAAAALEGMAREIEGLRIRAEQQWIASGKAEAELADLRVREPQATIAILRTNLDKAEAERDSYKQDAERYRWLRDNRVFSRPHDAHGPGYNEVTWTWSPYRGDPEALDAAIDAALATGKP